MPELEGLVDSLNMDDVGDRVIAEGHIRIISSNSASKESLKSGSLQQASVNRLF